MPGLKNAKSKGRILEKHVAQKIRAFGIDPKATYDGASGASTQEKADINTTMEICGRTAGIECKNYKNAHVKDWWKQAQKLEIIDREPILVYKLDRENIEEAKVILYLNTFLELVANQGDGKELELDVKIKWKLKKAKDAINDLMKCF